MNGARAAGGSLAGASRRAAVVVASTRAAAGIYEDRTGPVIQEWLRGNGFDVEAVAVVADGDAVGDALRELVRGGCAVVVTSGGTGLSPDDRTPEQTKALLDIEVPGIMEAIRHAGAGNTPTAILSRGHAGVAGKTFIINLPGSPGGVRDGLAVLGPVLGHLCDQLEGSHEH